MKEVQLFDKKRECATCGTLQPWKTAAANPDAEVLAVSVQVYCRLRNQPANAGSERICQGCIAKAAAAPQSAHGRKVAELLLRRAAASLRKILEAA